MSLPLIHDFKKFFFRIILLLFVILVIDQAAGRIIRYFYFKQSTGTLSRTTYAIDSTHADILIFGSSRASHHYVPEVFENYFHKSFYNVGRDGNYLLYNYAVFKAILNRYVPKVIIFDICPDELCSELNNYDYLSSLLPYYKDHPEFRNVIELRSPFERIKLISEVYPFNSCIINVIIGNIGLRNYRMEDRNGYIPLKNVMKDCELKTKDFSCKESLDVNKLNALTEIILLCKKMNIKLLFIQSPIYAKVADNETMQKFNLLIQSNNAIFWDYTNNPDFLNNPGYFQDQLHLNETGADYFSEILVDRLARFF
jgi:hypothetical protein